MYCFRYDPTILREGIEPDMTPLHYAIVRDQEDLAIRFVEAGASVNQPDR